MEATLEEILASREARVQKQQALLAEYQKPLICFTMNIPGPVKQGRDIAIGFAVGDRLLRNLLNKYPIFYRQLQYETTGCTGWYVVDASAQTLKQLAIAVEDTDPIGRLFDIDVLDTDGQKLSREKMGLTPRKCLICEENAAVCASTRAHGLEALIDRTRYLLFRCATEWLPEFIAAQAWLALNHEFLTTPKPGLVDRNNQGSHPDMGLRHFFASSNALRPFFARFATEGLMTRDADPKNVFPRLRAIGIEAEQAMYEATGGINTHKGAIFSIGLLCAVLGRISPAHWNPEELCKECARISAGVTAGDFVGVTLESARTSGEKIFAQYGISGVRGEAEAGFPAVTQIALPVLRQGLQNGLSLNDAGCAVLLHLMAAIDDTNLIHRSNRETQLQIKADIANLLKNEPYPTYETLLQLDKNFIDKNLSPGGSADLLAVTLLLQFVSS